MKLFGPDVVIGTGGYASAPLLKAAQKLGIPTYIHEQNAFPGVTNKMLEKRVKKVFLGFEEASKYFKYPDKHVVCGNPIRGNFLDTDKDVARKSLDTAKMILFCWLLEEVRERGRINKAMIGVIEAWSRLKI